MFRALPRVLRLFLAGLVFAVVPVGAALAQTSTQTVIGRPGGDPGEQCRPGGLVGDTNDVVPSGGGTITSFSFQSTPQNTGEQLVFLALRPVGGNTHTVVGRTGVVTLAGTGLETFPAGIAVQGGDILGFWAETFLDNCLRSVAGGGGLLSRIAPEPTVGSTVGFGTPDSLLAANVSATLEPALPTSRAQCDNGGWTSFGVFKNHGQCVRFVATGGRHGPGGS